MTDNISNVTLGTENINKVFLGDSLVWRRFSIESLYLNGEQGVWLEPSDISTMFQDVAGTVPVTKDGSPVSLIRDKSGNGNHAVQSVSAARPVYKDNPARLSLDKVDDAIVIRLPSNFKGTLTIATTTGTATYGVTMPRVNYTLGGRYFPSDNIVGIILREGGLSASEESKVEAYLLSKGAVKSFAGITDFRFAWQYSYLTSFPMIDTSNGTNFESAWNGNDLTSFPLIDTSNGTNFSSAWRVNKLTSFPLIDTSNGTNFNSAWRYNELTSFPLIDTSNGTDFNSAWYNNRLTSFPLLDVSKGIDFTEAWADNPFLVDFPEHMFDNVKSGAFNRAFYNTSLSQSSIDGILVSLVTSGVASGTRIFTQSGGRAPSAIGQAAIDTLRSRGWTVSVTGWY